MFSLSLLSSVPLFIFLSQLCFLLFFYVGLTFSFFPLYVFCVALSLSPYIFLEHFQRQGAEEKEEEGQGEESYRSQHRSELVDS